MRAWPIMPWNTITAPFKIWESKPYKYLGWYARDECFMNHNTHQKQQRCWLFTLASLYMCVAARKSWTPVANKGLTADYIWHELYKSDFAAPLQGTSAEPRDNTRCIVLFIVKDIRPFSAFENPELKPKYSIPSHQ